MMAVDADALDGLPLEDALARILIAFGELALSEDAIWLHRLLDGESHSFPELTAAFYEAMQRIGAAIAAWLQRQSERGLITLDNVEVAAGMLRGMMVMEPQHAVRLGQRALPGPDEIAARAKFCVRLFLEGCRPAHR